MEKSDVYLQRRKTGEAVPAELWDEISREHIKLWRTTWLPLINQKKESLKANNVPEPTWPEDLHWQMDDMIAIDPDPPLITKRSYALMCERALQGLMAVDLTKMVGRMNGQIGWPASVPLAHSS